MPLGALSQATSKTLLMQIELPPGADDTQAVADVTLAYTDLTKTGADARAQVQGHLDVSLTREAAQLIPLDAIVLSRLTRAETAAALRDANRLFSAGDASAAHGLLGDRLDALERRSGAISSGASSGHLSRDANKDLDWQRRALEGAKKDFAEPKSWGGKKHSKNSKKKMRKHKERIKLGAEDSALMGL